MHAAKGPAAYNRHMHDTFDFDRYDRIRPIRWTGDALELLDQRKLPFQVEYVRCETSDEVAAAIHSLTVRGAPAIGIAAAWGVVLAGMKVEAADGAEAALGDVGEALEQIQPTNVVPDGLQCTALPSKSVDVRLVAREQRV